MADSLNLLIIEDSEEDALLLLRALRQKGHEVVHQRVASETSLRAALDAGSWDAVISDFSMPGFSGTKALDLVRAKGLDVPFIFVSGTIGEELAVEAMRTGAQDYVMKGNLARLVPAIERELREASNRREQKRAEMRIRQLEKFEAIGKLAGGIAHDFNNVIGAILGWAELGLEGADSNGAAARYFKHIRSQAERAAGLTRQLLAYARRQVLEPRAVNLNHLITESAAMLQRGLGEHIEMRSVLAPDLLAARADPAQIEQVLMNLCFNARDAMPGGGELLVETKNIELDAEYCRRHEYARRGRYVRLSVSDTGTGMDAATLERIFEPFFTTKQPGKGTGLGLSTAYGIVKQHEGTIEVYSELGKGSVFHVMLPVGGDDVRRAPDLQDAAPVRRGSETILVAEDHDGTREMVQEALAALGYRVVCARDGREALEMFKSTPEISLVIMDVVMPKLGGIESAAEIRKICPGVRVLFTSGYSEQSERLSSTAGDGLLQKPYSTAVLARKIRDVLDCKA